MKPASSRPIRFEPKYIFPITVVFFVAFFLLALITKGHGFTDYDFTLITVAAFIFGIFIGFTIINNLDKLNKVNELLKTHDANFLLLYKLVQQYDKTIVDKFRELIDKHMMDELDYRLADFQYSAPSFYKLYDFLADLEPKTEKQSIIYHKIMDTLGETAEARQQVEVITKKKISQYEWFSIFALFTFVCVLILRINEGTVFTALLSSALVTPLLVLILVLQTFNNLRWQEATQIWEPLHHLFLSLDLLPYYPDVVIKSGRFTPPGPGKIRVANYPHPYPDMTGREITIVEVA